MRISLLTRLIGALLELISQDMIRIALTSMCDALIKFIENSENKVDDAVLPILHKIKAIVSE